MLADTHRVSLKFLDTQTHIVNKKTDRNENENSVVVTISLDFHQKLNIIEDITMIQMK